jgi:hypothetical protein
MKNICRNTVKFAFCLTILSCVMLANTHQARAQTLVYDNGTFATTQAYNISAASIADDFSFSSSQTFDQVRVWLLDATPPNNTLNAFSGTLSWLIRSNNAGSPGSVLSSGTVSGGAITQTDTGVNATFYRIFQIDFAISSTTLTAGTYWFQIKENGLTDPTDGSPVAWLDAGSSTGFATKFDSDPVNPTTWTAGSDAKNRAFQFFATAAPEPGTLALLAIGGTGLVSRLRRRKR